MGTALKIRQDYTAGELRRLARRSRDADWSRRLLPCLSFTRAVLEARRRRLAGWVYKSSAIGLSVSICTVLTV